MSTLLDLLPIVFFAIAYKLSDIYTATAVLMGSSALAAVALWVLYKHLTGMQKTALTMILGFGTVTLIFRNEDFIKWKPTVLYALSAIAFAYMTWVKKKNLTKVGLADKFALPDAVWDNLNLAWILYFVFMAVVNSYVVLNLTTAEWVSFKLWSIGLTLVFVVGQVFYMFRHLPPEEEAQP
jgi:intracellular septation protein